MAESHGNTPDDPFGLRAEKGPHVVTLYRANSTKIGLLELL